MHTYAYVLNSKSAGAIAYSLSKFMTGAPAGWVAMDCSASKKWEAFSGYCSSAEALRKPITP